MAENYWDGIKEKVLANMHRQVELYRKAVQGGDLPPFMHQFTPREEQLLLEKLGDQSALPEERAFAEAVYRKNFQRIAEEKQRQFRVQAGRR